MTPVALIAGYKVFSLFKDLPFNIKDKLGETYFSGSQNTSKMTFAYRSVHLSFFDQQPKYSGC